MKPVLVFIHGFCETSQIWNKLISHLDVDCPIFLVDLPGHHGIPMQGEGSIEDVARTVANRLFSEFGNMPFVLVGHSMGYYVALEMIQQKSIDVRGLICFHSHPYGDAPEKQKGRDKARDFVQRHGAASFIRKTLPRLYYPDYFNSNHVEILELCAQFIQHIPASVIMFYLEAMKMRPNREELVSSLNIPMGYLIGRQETTLAFEDLVRQTSLNALSSVQILENCNHMGMITSPINCGLFIQDYLSWLKRLSSAPDVS